MLHWLHQKLIKYTATLGNALQFSLSIHSILIGLVFFGYRGGPDLRLVVQKKESAIVRLLPLGAAKPAVRAAANKKLLTSPPVEPHNVIRHKKKATAIVHNKKNKKIKKVAKKELGKEVTQEPQHEQSKLPEPEQHQPVVVEEPAVAAQADTDVHKNKAQCSEDNVMYVTQKELDLLKLQQQLKDALEQVWVAPAGADPDMICEAYVMIGWDGIAVETSLLQPTGSYVYDSAVERALEMLVFPQELWGKSLEITFKP